MQKLVYGCLFFLLCVAVNADTLTGKVIRIIDGDTVVVLVEGNVQEKIRLSGIDAPERKQPFGTVSRQLLASMAFEKTVIVDFDKRDRWGRIIGKIIFEEQDLNLSQIEKGLAWHYKTYQVEQSEEDRELYSQAEIRARSSKAGLWSDPHAIPPWNWRKGIK